MADCVIEIKAGSHSFWLECMFEPQILASFYLSSFSLLDNSGEAARFWLWSGNCGKYGKTRTRMNGLFCANFGSCRDIWGPCRQVWCGDCYVPNPHNRFHVHQPADESSFEWQKEGERNHFSVARNGDHLITPFQCDLCLFCLLKRRSPMLGAWQDDLL